MESVLEVVSGIDRFYRDRITDFKIVWFTRVHAGDTDFEFDKAPQLAKNPGAQRLQKSVAGEGRLKAMTGHPSIIEDP